MSSPRAAAAVCLVVHRNQQVTELFVSTLHVSHYFPCGRYTASSLVSIGIFSVFFLFFILVCFLVSSLVKLLQATERQGSGMRGSAETCALTPIHSSILLVWVTPLPQMSFVQPCHSPQAGQEGRWWEIRSFGGGAGKREGKVKGRRWVRPLCNPDLSENSE